MPAPIGRDGPHGVVDWMKNTPELKLGREAEVILREWLKQQGYVLLPASLIEQGGAPMLNGKNLKLILPDNLSWKEGQPGWVEVKTKSHPTLHNNPPHRWEHGFPLRQWRAYCQVQEITKIPVYLAVLELETAILLIGSLSTLARGERLSEINKEPHIFLNRLNPNGRSDFERWYSIDLSLPTPIQPMAERTQTQGPAPIQGQPRLL